MTTLQTSALALVLTPGRKGGTMGKYSVSKRVCLTFVFCVATAIASPAQTFTILVNFDGPNGANPYASLIQAADGNFYGNTFYGGSGYGFCTEGGNGCGTVFKVTPSGTLITLYNFCPQGHCLNGANPSAALVQATDGNFYGTTSTGGDYSGGTVFKITPAGVLTTMYSFDGTTRQPP